MKRFVFACVMALTTLTPHAQDEVWRAQEYKPSPLDNPLRGLVPFASKSDADKRAFPHSMEFGYLPLAPVVKGKGQYDWTTLETFLNDVAGRGHQAVFRFYLEYPDKPSGVPAFLTDAGVGIIQWPRVPSQPNRPATPIMTPDYRNPLLQEALADFVAALGRRYDGDPRIGFIQAGLLGIWGKWHDYPKQELFADKDLQQKIIGAYAQAFKRTGVLLRYPVGDGDAKYINNAHSGMGYHDDSFAWNTLPTRPNYLVAQLQSAGISDIWKTRPIGGEIRPEAQGTVFDANPNEPKLQDFLACVDATHVSWLIDSAMFRARGDLQRKSRAIGMVGKVGYELHVSQVALSRMADGLAAALKIENRGVAPFYYDWPLRWALLDDDRRVTRLEGSSGVISGLLPGAEPTIHNMLIPPSLLRPGKYRILVQVPNPLPRGKPLHFANTLQNADLDGWLTVVEFER